MKTRLIIVAIILLWCAPTYAQTIEFIDDNTSLAPDQFIRANKILRDETYRFESGRKGKLDSTFSVAANYKYDVNGNIVEKQSFDSNKKLTNTFTYVYNKYNQLVQCSNYYSDKVSSMSEFQYDSIGRHVLTTEQYFGTLGMKRVIKKVYDNKNRLLKVFQSPGDEVYKMMNQLHYDTLGYLSAIDHFDSWGAIEHTYIMDYDVEHNVKNVYIKYNGLIHFFEKDKYNGTGQLISHVFNSTDSRHSVPDAESADAIRKFVYSPDNTLNSEITYIDGEAKYIYKHLYKK